MLCSFAQTFSWMAAVHPQTPHETQQASALGRRIHCIA